MTSQQLGGAAPELVALCQLDEAHKHRVVGDAALEVIVLRRGPGVDGPLGDDEPQPVHRGEQALAQCSTIDTRPWASMRAVFAAAMVSARR
jgi:hypothetical protein